MKDILLGPGVFSIGEVPIGLTRGGGQFTVEKEFRQIEADGDKGLVKGRTVQDKATPKLTMNSLEVINENIGKMYAAIKVTKSEGKTIVTGAGKVLDTDYQDIVKWTGKTKAGRAVIIRVMNAINLENLDWTLADKDEAIASLTYQGAYKEDSPDDFEPWELEYVD